MASCRFFVGKKKMTLLLPFLPFSQISSQIWVFFFGGGSAHLVALSIGRLDCPKSLLHVKGT